MHPRTKLKLGGILPAEQGRASVGTFDAAARQHRQLVWYTSHRSTPWPCRQGGREWAYAGTWQAWGIVFFLIQCSCRQRMRLKSAKPGDDTAASLGFSRAHRARHHHHRRRPFRCVVLLQSCCWVAGGTFFDFHHMGWVVLAPCAPHGLTKPGEIQGIRTRAVSISCCTAVRFVLLLEC
jgi:hypothetical protein